MSFATTEDLLAHLRSEEDRLALSDDSLDQENLRETRDQIIFYEREMKKSKLRKFADKIHRHIIYR